MKKIQSCRVKAITARFIICLLLFSTLYSISNLSHTSLSCNSPAQHQFYSFQSTPPSSESIDPSSQHLLKNTGLPQPIEKEASRQTQAFDGNLALSHVITQVDTIGPRFSGSQNRVSCSDYIFNYMKGYGYNTTFQNFTEPLTGIEMGNIVATKKMAAEGEENIVIFATHYDTRPFADRDLTPSNRSIPVPGANDGASGVGVLIELARVLKDIPLNYTLMFVFFDGSDYVPNATSPAFSLRGGAASFASTIDSANSSRIYGIYYLNMVGDRNLNVCPVSPVGIPGKVGERIVELNNAFYSAAEKLQYPEFNRSALATFEDDHYKLIEAGLPAAAIIDADYSDSSGVNYYHTAGDTADKISETSLKKIGTVCVEVALKLSVMFSCGFELEDVQANTTPFSSQTFRLDIILNNRGYLTRSGKVNLNILTQKGLEAATYSLDFLVLSHDRITYSFNLTLEEGAYKAEVRIDGLNNSYIYFSVRDRGTGPDSPTFINTVHNFTAPALFSNRTFLLYTTVVFRAQMYVEERTTVRNSVLYMGYTGGAGKGKGLVEVRKGATLIMQNSELEGLDLLTFSYSMRINGSLYAYNCRFENLTSLDPSLRILGKEYSDYEAGIHVIDGLVLLEQCTLYNSSRNLLMAYRSEIILNNSTLSTSTTYPAIVLIFSDAKIAGCIFSKNRCFTCGGAAGGAITALNSTISITSTDFTDNAFGIAVAFSNLTVDSCSFYNNSNYDVYAGYDSVLHIINTSFDEGTTAINTVESSLTASRCLFRNYNIAIIIEAGRSFFQDSQRYNNSLASWVPIITSCIFRNISGCGVAFDSVPLNSTTLLSENTVWEGFDEAAYLIRQGWTVVIRVFNKELTEITTPTYEVKDRANELIWIVNNSGVVSVYDYGITPEGDVKLFNPYTISASYQGRSIKKTLNITQAAEIKLYLYDPVNPDYPALQKQDEDYYMIPLILLSAFFVVMVMTYLTYLTENKST
ncbi:MAG: M28 family peptidase [Thermoplasmata archaeon]